jgi:hypothetical protein
MKYFFVLVLIMSCFSLSAQSNDNLNNLSQGVNQMQNISETVPNAYFPFGQPLKLVKQQDRSPKKVFVLGVYASAVHAEWYSADGKLLCQALAVASEPEIFWKGENVADIISKINIPLEAGKLKPAENIYNGPSGKTLDELYLVPLGFSRSDAWLCDLVPHYYMNDNQKKAIKEYNSISKNNGLQIASIPERPRNIAIDAKRRDEILAELEASQAKTVILLGDDTIKCFLSEVSDCKKTKLDDFGSNTKTYGLEYLIHINGKPYTVIPLAHVRQGGGLGIFNSKWQRLHNNWVKSKGAQ